MKWSALGVVHKRQIRQWECCSHAFLIAKIINCLSQTTSNCQQKSLQGLPMPLGQHQFSATKRTAKLRT